jgi:wyosine [tRNA(Phe)-imidazoG37] synthetase (radical SAM superfamily)
MSIVFGPVPSRRLGRSLGVDIVPFKKCSYDCIYCQLGRTTDKTVERHSWILMDDIIADLKGKLHTAPDYITLSGSGEPTLYADVGELISRIKELTDIPVAVLTNGSLLWQKEVRYQLKDADLVIPSLDAGDETIFQAVNRPHESIGFGDMLEGLITFRNEFKGLYWLEVFLLSGYTTVISDFNRLVKSAKLINPDRIQLNTVTRPAAEDYAVGISRSKMMDFAKAFGPKAEVITDFQKVHDREEFAAERIDVLEMLERRPCSLEDISAGLGLHRNEVIKYIGELTDSRLIKSVLVNGHLFYKAEYSGDAKAGTGRG